MKTFIYTAEVTEILSDHEYENNVPRDVHELANMIKEALDVDDVVITKVQVFENEID